MKTAVNSCVFVLEPFIPVSALDFFTVVVFTVVLVYSTSCPEITSCWCGSSRVWSAQSAAAVFSCCSQVQLHCLLCGICVTAQCEELLQRDSITKPNNITPSSPARPGTHCCSHGSC